ncbi:hypothetical protein QBC38DRAFT_363203 [Podospora fimiseda]|uniref:F-box domain-containing protein n=1 Tax=Podospora fimiseda TaxID=252190 RepID=A0AAN7H384_9PEZI|nr:hypothetical protein QBC38DRAFT_363203 [Podospora fimiseda]
METENSARQLQKISHYRGQHDFHTLDSNLPSPKSQPETQHPRQAPRTTIGALDVLPLELLQEILLELDLRTLTDFRHVNRYSTELVESLYQYEAINKHAPNALRGILSIGTGRWITCRTLYENLCTQTCKECRNFGGYLYLLTCKRVCINCWSNRMLYLPLSPRWASYFFGLDDMVVETLPQMKVVPGIYSRTMKRLQSRSVLVDYECARQAGIALYGSVGAMQKHAQQKRRENFSAGGKSIIDSISLGDYELDPVRFVAIVEAPWLNKSSQQVDWGFYCAGCSEFDPLLRLRRFTDSSFDRHVKFWGDIRDGKHRR